MNDMDLKSESLRQTVREECSADARELCTRPNSFTPNPPATMGMPPSLFDLGLFNEVDDPLVSSFVRSDPELQSVFLLEPIVEPLMLFADGNNAEGEVLLDFDALFDGMLEFSLRAFDSASIMTDEGAVLDPRIAFAPQEGGAAVGADEGEEVYQEDLAPLMEGEAQEGAVGVIVGEESTEAVEENPVVVAEEALDVLISSLFRRAAGEAVTSSEGDAIIIEGAETEVGKVSDRLANHGRRLLEEGASRRRLSAEDGTQDARAGMRERLARRLTEYRTDVFYRADGSVDVYTTSLPDRQPANAAPDFLGLGSRCLDRCVMNQYHLGATSLLSPSCHSAVGQIRLAATDDDNDRVTNMAFAAAHPPHTHSMHGHHGPCPMHIMMRISSFLLIGLLSYVICAGTKPLRVALMTFTTFVALMTFGLLGGAVVLAAFFLTDTEDEEEEECDGETDEEHEYLCMTDNDGADRKVETAKTQVFMGVPVQIV